MRTGLAYTTARILILVISLVVLYVCGARGFLLLGLAFVISALASYMLLYKQREKMAGALNRRISKTTSGVTDKVTEFRERLEEGAAAEDTDLPDSGQFAVADDPSAPVEQQSAVSGPAADAR
jgi:beta-lactamase regulating signal transducer with metallopeptidase domain